MSPLLPREGTPEAGCKDGVPQSYYIGLESFVVPELERILISDPACIVTMPRTGPRDKDLLPRPIRSSFVGIPGSGFYFDRVARWWVGTVLGPTETADLTGLF